MTDRDPSAAGDHGMILVEARSPMPFSETTHRRAIATGDLEAWQASTVPMQCANTARRTVGGLTAPRRHEVARLARQGEAEYDISDERRGHEGLRHERPCAGRRRLAA
jgi:hypothetical protein